MNRVKLNKLFSFDKGNSGSFDDYYDVVDSGAETVAYISCTTNKNGINGFVIPKESDVIFEPMTITVAGQGQGSVCYSTIQPHRFIASTLVLTLVANEDEFKKHGLNVDIETLSVICALIRKFRWRFSFGRTVDDDRLGELLVDIDKIKNVLKQI